VKLAVAVLIRLIEAYTPPPPLVKSVCSRLSSSYEIDRFEQLPTSRSASATP